MRSFRDTRGKSWYDIVPEMDGQIDITVNYPDTIRAFHWHDQKTEWMFVVTGEVKFVLTDPYEEVFCSQGDVVKIDPKRWHGYQALGNAPAIVMEYGNKKHDLKNPDDKREEWNKFHAWTKERK
jgi:dTDP-4-dehydrorhamnose 3,5-epimerase-like enzyme